MDVAFDISTLPSEPDKLVALVASVLARVGQLENEVSQLRTENAKLKETIEDLRVENSRLRRENTWLKKQLFGPKRERVDPSRLHAAWARFQSESATGPGRAGTSGDLPMLSTSLQLVLGLVGGTQSAAVKPNEPACGQQAGDAAPALLPPASPPSRKRKRHDHGRSTLPEHLPVERIILEPDVIPEGARRIGEEVSERIGYRKASYVRLLVVRPKWAVDNSDGTTRVELAPTPEEMIPRGLCDPAMLAHLIMAKWGDHLPWNRLEGICARQGLPLAATTMAGAAKRAEPLAKCVVDAMWTEARDKAKVLGIDATTVKVQAKGKCQKGYPWVVVADRDHVLFGFSTRHSSEVPKELLRGFRGFALADASSVYDRMFALDEPPLEAGCWSHCRRRFFYAAPADERALIGLNFADRLFALEREFKDLSPSERRACRLEQSRPILDAFAAWRQTLLEDLSVDPRGPLRGALNYSLNHWAALRRFLDDGHIPISNNFTELQIRHIALGRNCWLFFGSEPDALVACTWLSLIASAKLHGINPEEYLRDLFRILPAWPKRRALELAPKYWRQTRARIEPVELARPLGAVSIPAAERDEAVQ